MGMSSPIHLFVLVGIAMFMLGGERLSSAMANVAKGLKAFKKGVAEPE